jgi:hypothetical protein
MITESCDRQTVEALPTYINGAALPQPAFSLFEVAVMRWRGDDRAETVSEIVQIVGVTWCPAHARIVGWWYEVRNLHPPRYSSLAAGYQEDCSEDELFKMCW